MMNLTRVKAGVLAFFASVSMTGCAGEGNAKEKDVSTAGIEETVEEYRAGDIEIFRLVNNTTGEMQYYALVHEGEEVLKDAETAKEEFKEDFGGLKDIQYAGALTSYKSPLDDDVYYLRSGFMATNADATIFGYSDLSTFTVGDISYTTYTKLGEINGEPIATAAYMTMIMDLAKHEVLDSAVWADVFFIKVAPLSEYFELDENEALSKSQVQVALDAIREAMPHQSEDQTRA